MSHLKIQISYLKWCFYAPAMLVLAACGGRKHEPLALQWRLEPAKVLRIDAKIRDGLKIHSRLYQGEYTQVITYGIQERDAKMVTQDGEAVTIEAESAALYVAENQALELTGDIDGAVTLWNHKAPVTVKSRNIHAFAARNHKKELTLAGVENVNVQNMTGRLEVNGCGGRFEAVNVEGDVRAAAVQGGVEVANLKGNFTGQGLACPTMLTGLDGNTSATGTGDVTVMNFGLELEGNGGFTPGLKERGATAKALGAKGKTLHIQTTGRARLVNINARALTVEAFEGLDMVNIFALRAVAAGKRSCAVLNVQSPLALRGCRGGTVENIELDYELVDCAGLMICPGGEAPPQGVLRDCRNLVFWDTPQGSVTQENSRNVIFVNRE